LRLTSAAFLEAEGVIGCACCSARNCARELGALHFPWDRHVVSRDDKPGASCLAFIKLAAIGISRSVY
jgi:hypothetical protein